MNKGKADIAVIGGILVDIQGYPYGQLVPGDSNPGKISVSYGGVGRNIAENLARLGARTGFLSLTGDDFLGRTAVRELSELGVNTEFVRFMEGENTAVYLSILNIIGDMEMGLCNMEVLERFTREDLDAAAEMLQNAQIVALDTNLTEEMLDYVTKRLAGIPLFLEPVSAEKAVRARDVIGRFHTIKPNRMEAEALCGMQILSEDELTAAGSWFCKQGVKRVFITLGGGGVYYKEGAAEGVIRPKSPSIVSATGAGDAFAAAILDGYLKGMPIRETAKYGMAASALTMESAAAVNPALNTEELKKSFTEMFG